MREDMNGVSWVESWFLQQKAVQQEMLQELRQN